LDFIGTHALNGHVGEFHVFSHTQGTFVGADIDGNGKDDFEIPLFGNVRLTQHPFVF